MVSRRTWLGAMAASALAESRTRLMWDDANVSHLGAPSPDGRFVTMADAVTGDLAIRLTATGEVKRLTRHAAGSGEFAYFSVVSADSRRIAYAWYNRERFYELRVMEASGGEPVVVHRNRERPFVQPCAWTPDGKRILTLFFREDNISQIAFVPAAGGDVQVMQSLDWVYPNKMDLSPDGKWIVYDDLSGESEGKRTLYLLAADGSAKKRLLAKPGNEVFPLFARDGKRIHFLRGGEWWSVASDGGEAVRGEALGRALPLGMTRQGSLYYALRVGEPGIFVAAQGEAPVRVANGSGDPAWSRDGKRLAFLTRAANENFGMESKVIGVLDAATGKTRILEPKLAHMDRVEWDRDGLRLLVGGSDRHGQRGLFVVDADSGATKPLVREHAGTYVGLAGVATERGVVYCAGQVLRLLEGEGKERDLYRGTAALVHLAGSPDGRRVAFAEQAGVSEVVFTMALEDATARQAAVLRGGGAVGLDWDAEGETLLASIPSDPPSVWRVFPDGAKPVRLAWNLRQAGAVRVQPGTGRVAFRSGRTRTEIRVLETAAK